MDGSANPIFFEFLNKNIAFGTYDMLGFSFDLISEMPLEFGLQKEWSSRPHEVRDRSNAT